VGPFAFFASSEPLLAFAVFAALAAFSGFAAFLAEAFAALPFIF
jgi:hypothetical protein